MSEETFPTPAPSSFAPPSLMVPAEDYLAVIRECDRIQAKIDNLKTRAGLPVTPRVRTEPVGLSAVLSALISDRRPLTAGMK